MTDTHCHLDYFEPEELDAALENAKDFRALVSVGINPERIGRTLEIAGRARNIYVAAGLHPTEAQHLEEAKNQLAELAKHPKVRAIGETGLDFYWKPETRDKQYEALDFQAALADKLNLPLIFHIRSPNGDDRAEREIADWLKLHRPRRLVLHAFGGHQVLAQIGGDLGAYFSFGGPLTYKKNIQAREVAKVLPVEKLLVETDSPFLPPEPHRGKRNQPAFVRFTLAKLAEVREVPVEVLEHITDSNAETCFAFREN